MGVTLCHLDVAVRHQALDRIEFDSSNCKPTGKGVAQVVESEIFDLSSLKHGSKRGVDVVIAFPCRR